MTARQEAPENGTPPDVSICVATCERPGGLARLLASFDALEIPDGCSIEIVVVDNAPGGVATDARRHPGTPRLPARWLEEPERNIALARNRALDAARGRWVAFIDDDETADPHWLAAYWAATRSGDADGWLGPVLPALERVVTPWLDIESFFSRPRHATGSPVPSDELRTGNAFMRRELFAAARFDLAYGLSGGEDLALFAGLQRAGARFRWCDEAIVVESIPPERHRLGWLARRAFRGGVVFSHFTRDSRGPVSPLRSVPRPLAILIALALALPFAALRGRRSAARLWLRLCTQAGHLWACAGGRYEPYAPRGNRGTQLGRSEVVGLR